MTDHLDIPSLADLEARLARVSELDTAALEAESIAVLGRKSGVLTAALRRIPALPPEERRQFGATVNALKARFEDAFSRRRAELDRAGTARGPAVDLTLPGRRRWIGGLHPVTRVVNRVVEIFRGLGFTVATGPEAETEWHNFLALNFPPDHPAMDMHDTLYLKGEKGEKGERLLLRTHTSPVQIRVMQAGPPPYRVVIPGMCYRKDEFDASHAPAFSQIEGLAVDEGIGFVDLKATLIHFAHELFGPERGARFRPSFFPFTEPSAEMDLQCGVCGGSGCPVCKHTGWVEILGCGMVHPTVLENCGVDSERYTGWAFGMGPGRVALTRYGVPDLRLFYEGDMRVLGQFAGAA
ncbi:MAG TPA: phenylalanine--tRNA ligase subunit alpha [Gemmatimonadales bacterium]